jgi:hypothetical protein
MLPQVPWSNAARMKCMPAKGRNHYIHSTLGPSRVDVRFLGNYKVDVAHIRPEWNGCTHVDL